MILCWASDRVVFPLVLSQFFPAVSIFIIKYGIRSALNDNRRYPVLRDYKLVASQERPLDLELAAIAPIIEIQIKGTDRLCKFQMPKNLIFHNGFKF
jgi:hypothetical protein